MQNINAKVSFLIGMDNFYSGVEVSMSQNYHMYQMSQVRSFSVIFIFKKWASLSLSRAESNGMLLWASLLDDEIFGL